MIEYLRATPLILPTPITTATETFDEGMGTVTPTFEAGDLFLKDQEGSTFRLSWSGDEEPEARTRALPAGKYVLRTYRIVREEDDESWHVSATHPSIQEVEVKAGGNVQVEVDDSIRIGSRIAQGRAQMTIQGENGAGLSIYRAAKRIPIDFRILDADGVQLAAGHMRYG